MTFPEVAVSGLFCLLAISWLFRDPGFCPGWTTLFRFPSKTISDGTVATVFAMILFVCPSTNVFATLKRKWAMEEGEEEEGEEQEEEEKTYETLLDWETAARKLPWGILLLLGSGFALAEGMT